MLVEVNKTVKSGISKKFIRNVLLLALQTKKKNKVIGISEISVALVSESIIKELNRKYLQINKPTDVLAFSDPAQIIVCWPQVIKQAKEFSHTQKTELTILLVHGLLHILGYNHKTEKQKLLMEKETNRIFAYFREKNFKYK